MRFPILLILLCSMVSGGTAQTIELGENVFSSEEGGINIAVNSGVAARKLDSPYLMFMLFMGADDGVSATITPKDIVLVHRDRTYNMPTLDELRKNYRDDSRDVRTYTNLTLAPMYSSRLRFLLYDDAKDFFPTLREGTIPIRAASVNANIGFRTKAYFKNPGIQPGDSIVILVRDKDDPDIWGSVAVEF
jgi:hypothetical protein